MPHREFQTVWIFLIEIEVLPMSPAFSGRTEIRRAEAFVGGATLAAASERLMRYCASVHIATIRKIAHANAATDADLSDARVAGHVAKAAAGKPVIEILGGGVITPADN